MERHVHRIRSPAIAPPRTRAQPADHDATPTAPPDVHTCTNTYVDGGSETTSITIQQLAPDITPTAPTFEYLRLCRLASALWNHDDASIDVQRNAPAIKRCKSSLSLSATESDAPALKRLKSSSSLDNIESETPHRIAMPVGCSDEVEPDGNSTSADVSHPCMALPVSPSDHCNYPDTADASHLCMSLPCDDELDHGETAASPNDTPFLTIEGFEHDGTTLRPAVDVLCDRCTDHEHLVSWGKLVVPRDIFVSSVGIGVQWTLPFHIPLTIQQQCDHANRVLVALKSRFWVMDYKWGVTAQVHQRNLYYDPLVYGYMLIIGVSDDCRFIGRAEEQLILEHSGKQYCRNDVRGCNAGTLHGTPPHCLYLVYG
jgi:hypothetical protein